MEIIRQSFRNNLSVHIHHWWAHLLLRLFYGIHSKCVSSLYFSTRKKYFNFSIPSWQRSSSWFRLHNEKNILDQGYGSADEKQQLWDLKFVLRRNLNPRTRISNLWTILFFSGILRILKMQELIKQRWYWKVGLSFWYKVKQIRKKLFY